MKWKLARCWWCKGWYNDAGNCRECGRPFDAAKVAALDKSYLEIIRENAERSGAPPAEVKKLIKRAKQGSVMNRVDAIQTRKKLDAYLRKRGYKTSSFNGPLE